MQPQCVWGNQLSAQAGQDEALKSSQNPLYTPSRGRVKGQNVSGIADFHGVTCRFQESICFRGIYLGLERSILGVAALVCYARRGVVSQCQRTNLAATAAVK